MKKIHDPVSSLTCLSCGASTRERTLSYFPFQVCLCSGMKRRTAFIIGISLSSVSSLYLFFSPRILGSCTSLMQAIQVLIVASKDLQREIVESGRVSVGEGRGTGRTDISYIFPAHWEAKSTWNTHPHSVKSVYIAFAPCVSIWGRSCCHWGCQQMSREEAGTLPSPQRAARHSFQLRAH